MRRRDILGVVAGAGAGLAGCSSVPRVTRFEAPPEGTRLVYQRRDSGSYGSGEGRVEVVVRERLWQGRTALVYERAQATSEVRARDTLQLLALLGPQGQAVLTYDPPVGVEPPLEAGRRWTAQSTVTTAATGRSAPIELRYEVEAWDRLSVAAGRFTVWVIRIDAADGEEERIWLAEDGSVVVRRVDRRPPSHPLGAGLREVELVERVPPK
jgi:hypothetical protein